MMRRISWGLLLAAGLGAAQDGATLSGQVSDHGAPVAGAIVTISHRGFVKSVTTDADGRFAIDPVPVGRYDFRTTAHGYAIVERSVAVSAVHRNGVDVSLLPADQQSISVSDLQARKVATN